MADLRIGPAMASSFTSMLMHTAPCRNGVIHWRQILMPHL
jgi:hypothetical protein